jgi:uncharacterized protein YaiI (UPF0178 family)
MTSDPKPIEIFVDADACPVKDEVYRVARRYGLKVYVISNGGIRPPADPMIEIVIVDQGPDAADDWIAERAQAADIVITADIPLADRCLKKGAEVIGPTGRTFTQSSIGAALAQRSIVEHLRSTGEITGGPKPFGPSDRSRFLSELDQAINRAKRRK